MKRTLLALAMLLALASCNKNEEQQKPQQYNLQLDLTAQVDEGTTARAIDYKLSSGKVKYTLEGKPKMSVLTCIYEGNNLLYSRNHDWDVSDDGKSLKCNENINFTAVVSNPNNLRLIAVLGDATGTPNSLSLSSSYSPGNQIKVFSETEAATLNVPYIMDVKLGRNVSGFWVPKTETKIFKPYGHLVRVKMTNKTFYDVTISGLTSSKFIAKGASLNATAKTLTREDYEGKQTFPLSKEISIANSKSDQSVILWVPTLPTNENSYKLDLIAKDAPAGRLYSKMKLTKTTPNYENGKVYNAEITLYRTRIPNPLSLLSEDVLNYQETDFVDLPNYNYSNLSTYNGEDKVGYFKAAYIRGKYTRDNHTFPKTGATQWHLPNRHEWNSILFAPNRIGSTHTYERVKDGVVAVQVNNYKASVAYQTYNPQTNADLQPGQSFYVLAYGKTATRVETDFNAELSNDNRFAFRYTLAPGGGGLIITCAPVGVLDISSAEELAASNVFNSNGAVTRHIRFYGVAEVGVTPDKATQKSTTWGLGTVADYIAKDGYFGAFSILNNAVVEDWGKAHEIYSIVKFFKRTDN
jgi:lipoprotein